MAYMSQEHKKKIAAELKKFMPKNWKYSLRVNNHSEIAMTIRQAPVDLPAMIFEQRAKNARFAEMDFYKDKSNIKDIYSVNIYYIERQVSEEFLPLFRKIVAALNLDNHDNSDAMTDYFDVGHYVSLDIGQWDKPFQVAK